MITCVKKKCYDGLSNTQKYNGKILTGNEKRVEASSRVQNQTFLNLTEILFDTLFRGCNYQDKDCTFLKFQMPLRFEGKMLLWGVSIFLLLYLAYI